MSDTDKKEQTSTHKIVIYLWIWGLLFVLSFFSYMVDWYQFQGMLRWSLILFFMFLKAGLIMAFFMHLFWERYALVNVLLWPMTAIACFIFLMVAEFKYTLFTRLFYFFVGGEKMDGYSILAGLLIFFLFFIYITWFGFSIKVENEKNEGKDIKINPYDNLPFHRKLIDKKNNKVEIFDLGNHILIIGMILLVIFVSINVD
jgi:cytochrome c oxidase subunit 4